MNQKTNREQIIREAKSNIILDAARKVFAEQGFHEARLEDIAAQAGFSKASLYTYYKDKETIFLSLANREFNQLILATKECIIPGESVYVSLEKMLRVGFTFFGSHFAFINTAMNFKGLSREHITKVSQYHRDLMIQFKSRFESILQVYINFIAEGQSSGEVRKDLDSRVLAGQIMSLHRGVLMTWAMQETSGDIEQEIQNIILFAKNGLSSPE
jgi:TetR/AcrR family fatty acid metabolism transcriptional regulator